MTSVDKKSDILIFGGGIAGISCAYIAAKNGLSVVLAEEKDYLGGLITGGLVVPMMNNDSQDINQEFLNDLITYSKKYNAQIEYGDHNPFWFHPIKLKNIFFEMLNDVGCEIIFNSKIKNFKLEDEDKKISCVEIKQKTLSLSIYSKYYIDGTGCGNFSKILNCEFLNDSKDKKQAKSLRFIMSNVDSEKLANFLLEYDKDREVTTAYKINGVYYLSTAYTWDTSKKWELRPLFDKAVNDNVLKLDDTDYFQIFSVAGEPASIAFNCPRLKGDDENKAIQNGKEAIKRLANFAKKYLPGFENAYVSEIADMIGIRENGRVKCKYTFKIDDIINEKKPQNPVLHSNYPIDIHSEKQNESVLRKNCGYYLPIESLMSFDYNNLFVIGRCLGASFEAQASLRIQPNCASMGESVAKYIKRHLE